MLRGLPDSNWVKPLYGLTIWLSRLWEGNPEGPNKSSRKLVGRYQNLNGISIRSALERTQESARWFHIQDRPTLNSLAGSNFIYPNDMPAERSLDRLVA